MLTLPEKIVFIFAVIASVGFSILSFGRMIKVINRGQSQLCFDSPLSRIREAISVLITQKTVFKKRPLISFLHALIAWAFTLYFLVNLGDMLGAFIPDFHFMGQGIIGDIYRLFVDFFSVCSVLSVFFFLLRRFIWKSRVFTYRDNVLVHPQALSGIRRDSLIVGLFIMLHVGFRFIGQAAELRLSPAGFDEWQPFASALATSLPFLILSWSMAIVLQHLSFWLAIGLILAFIPYFPSSKHIHLFMGPINYLTRPRRNAYGTLEKLDLENDQVEQFGVAKLEHLDKKQILDAYACIMCNRCQDVCPAYVTGKELSPSALEINKRYFINENKKLLARGDDSGALLTEYALRDTAVWACTSCAACVEACPVGNEPMYDILNIRRDKVLMESQFPKQLQTAFTGMERNGNPWNFNKNRMEWAQAVPELNVPTIEENPTFEILYWVGCAGAFDQRGQKIAQAFAQILNKAGVNFAVLGSVEQCTGDSARRAGNEYLFAMLAQTNVANLNAAKVKKIVTHCPHCLHTIKNEYPQFGGEYEVVHHSQFIQQLVKNQKLKIKNQNNLSVAFHDPCYLGRHNHIFDEPRQALKSSGFAVKELNRNRVNSFCCGAGGAQMWKEEEPGAEAVRRERFKEVQQTGVDTLCTSCPFCLTMLRDAGNELGAAVQVKDIAEVIAERMDGLSG